MQISSSGLGLRNPFALRLDRLLVLLDLGSSPSIRETAARQIAQFAAKNVAKDAGADFVLQDAGPSASTSTAVWQGTSSEWNDVMAVVGKVSTLKHLERHLKSTSRMWRWTPDSAILALQIVRNADCCNFSPLTYLPNDPGMDAAKSSIPKSLHLVNFCPRTRPRIPSIQRRPITQRGYPPPRIIWEGVRRTCSIRDTCRSRPCTKRSNEPVRSWFHRWRRGR